MSTEVQLMTADELLALPRGEFRYELVNGELKKMSPAGHNHGRLAIRIAAPLYQHVMAARLGEVYAAETGFILTQNPDTVRAPDVAFIRQERVDQVASVKSFWVGAPDLAAEVISPGDSSRRVEEKVREWLRHGTRMVWVISQKTRTITIYRSLSEIVILTDQDTLDGGDVVPGFTIKVMEIFGK